MGYYIQPEHNPQPDYDELADKISNMLAADKIQQVKALLDDEQVDISLQDLTMLKQILFDSPSIDSNVCEAEFDWHDAADDADL